MIANHHFWCIIGLLVFAIILWFVARDFRIKEGYGVVLGSIGSYKTTYYECLSECEREDPSRFLGKTRGSLYCQQFCDDGITELSKKNLPPAKDNFSIRTLEMEGCQYQVSSKCAQECRYSKNPECQELCRKVNAVNCSTVSWIWK